MRKTSVVLSLVSVLALGSATPGLYDIDLSAETASLVMDLPEVVEALAGTGGWEDADLTGGAAGSAKHFPGHGDTSQDSHIELARVLRDRRARGAHARPDRVRRADRDRAMDRASGRARLLR